MIFYGVPILKSKRDVSPWGRLCFECMKDSNCILQPEKSFKALAEEIKTFCTGDEISMLYIYRFRVLDSKTYRFLLPSRLQADKTRRGFESWEHEWILILLFLMIVILTKQDFFSSQVNPCLLHMKRDTVDETETWKLLPNFHSLSYLIRRSETATDMKIQNYDIFVK